MTPQQLKAMKLALEALELLTGAWQTFDALDYGDNAITAIKEALAEHAMSEVQRLGQEIEQCNYPDCKCPTENPCLKGLAQPEQEPVAWLSIDSIGERHLCFDKPLDNDPVQPLYTAPPQRKPLTVQEIAAFVGTHEYGTEQLKWFRLGEAAHGIKENT